MADTVEPLLEAMVPVLEEMKETGLFSAAEISGIVDKRRDFEYLLRRRTARKTDFLRYINWEVELDELRELRKSNARIHKGLASDHAGQKNIHFTFTRALRKFRGDRDLWRQHIEYCNRTGANSVLNKLYPRVLQLLPHDIEFWVMAAGWQFDTLKDAPAARILLQRGLRFNPESTQLWAAYFRMELVNVQKIKAHLNVIQEQARRTGAGAGADDDDDDDSLPEDAIPTVVFEEAVKAVPDNMSFWMDMLSVAESVPNLMKPTSPILPDLCASILKRTVQAFSGRAQLWAFLAQRCVTTVQRVLKQTDVAETSEAGAAAVAKAEAEADAVFESGCGTVKDGSVFPLWVAFLKARADGAVADARRRTKLLEQICAVCEKATAAVPSVDVYSTHVNALVALDTDPATANTVAAAATTAFPSDSRSWLLLTDTVLRAQLKSGGGDAAMDLEGLVRVLDAGLAAVRVGSPDAEALLRRKAQLMIAGGAPAADVSKVFAVAAAQGKLEQPATVWRAFC